MTEHEHRWIDVSYLGEAKDRRMCATCGEEETKDLDSQLWETVKTAQEKFTAVAEIEVPADPNQPAKIIEYKGSTERREFIPGVIERVVYIHYSEEVHGKLDVVYVNGVRFVPEQSDD